VVAPDGTRTTVLEWLPLLSAFRDTVEWVLDVAADIAREYPEEVAAVERVRTFLRARMHGYPAALELRDALFTVGLLLAAIERDLGPLPQRGRSFKKHRNGQLPPGALEAAMQRALERLRAQESSGRIAA
jgi:hypothetical protein